MENTEYLKFDIQTTPGYTLGFFSKDGKSYTIFSGKRAVC